MSFQDFKNCQCEACGPNCQCGPDLSTEQLTTSQTKVFLKLLAAHGSAALVTLSVCPQFGLRLVGHGLWSLFDVFMLFGHEVCTVLCGLFFLGSGLVATRLVMSYDEWLAYEKNFWVMNLSIVVLAVMGFALAGAEIHHLHLGLWLMGALLALFIALRSPWRLAPTKVQ